MTTLSVIIPAYNMEAYLGTALGSIVGSEAATRVEVIVVNDGSCDSTLSIARRFEGLYPNIVRVVDKPNGNYGSTINAALPLCRGEYVRILDADDTFQTSHLGGYIEALERHSGVDMVVSPFYEESRKGLRRIDYDIYSRRLFPYDKALDAETVFADGRLRFFMMHGVAYRLAMLRDMGYRQSEGISYTDREWVFYPLFKVKSIVFVDIPLYRYNLMREGQTMDAAVQMRSVGQLATLAENMARYFVTADKAKMSEPRLHFLRETATDRIRFVLRKYLLEMESAQFDKSDFDSVCYLLTAYAESCGVSDLKVWVNNILRVDLLACYLRRGRRSPLRRLLYFAERSMVGLHAAIFRRA